MRAQKSDEESQILNEELKKDSRKASLFPNTIIGRRRFRDLREALWHIGIDVPIPMNSVYYSNDYCKKYGKKEYHDGFSLSWTKPVKV